MRDEPVVVQPEETTMRWFGPGRPPHHSLRGEVPVPTGEKCRDCGLFFRPGDQGWTIPRWGKTSVQEPYHHECLMKALGLGGKS